MRQNRVDTICQNIIYISIYPFIVSIKKEDKLYSKKKLVEYLFSDIGILIGGILIGRSIGNLIVDYNICLLVAVIFLILSFFVVINIKNIKVNKEKIELRKTIQYIIKDKIVILYILDYMISNIAMNTGLGLKMLMLTNGLDFSAGEATNFLLAVGLIADVIGIMALKYFTPKNDYITITIKFGIRMILYWIAFISNDLTKCLIAMTWSILILTAYENITDAPYINRIKNEYQMVFTNVRYMVGLVGTSIGLYFAGIMYGYGIAFNLGLSAFFVLFQLALTYYLVYLRKKEKNKKVKRRKINMKVLSYNVYGKKNVENPTPSWEIRQENLYKIINKILIDQEIEILCFQEVNQNNMILIQKICDENSFIILEKFPMKTRTINQYNIIAVKKDKEINIKNIHCLPHGKDEKYKEIKDQIIDFSYV